MLNLYLDGLGVINSGSLRRVSTHASYFLTPTTRSVSLSLSPPSTMKFALATIANHRPRDGGQRPVYDQHPVRTVGFNMITVDAFLTRWQLLFFFRTQEQRRRVRAHTAPMVWRRPCVFSSDIQASLWLTFFSFLAPYFLVRSG